MEIIGKVVRQTTEGGFWGIVTDDGKKYCPVEMPRKFRKDGARVRAKVEPFSGMSMRMWGMEVEVKQMTTAEDG